MQGFLHQRFQSFKNGLCCPVGCLVASPAGQSLSSTPLEPSPFLMAAGARNGIPTQHLPGRDSEAHQQTNLGPSCLLNTLRNLPMWLHSVSSASWWPVIKRWLSLAQVSCHRHSASASSQFCWSQEFQRPPHSHPGPVSHTHSELTEAPQPCSFPCEPNAEGGTVWTVGSWHILCHIPRNHYKMEHAYHLAVGILCTGRGLAHWGRKFRICPSFLDYHCPVVLGSPYLR